ncbi:formyltetrahydrofolate deformylase [Salinisphaera sp. LB1]|uniref:formyltetrahydrofolate deformylase n=1 Tax=Salinisphaera sp. LB1 TaxID=2183911 RepID=UPI000D7071F4|nr:formyltetrahydrofolate deformylase [Salinisphaera sp. LB1]AWN15119.1 Formyltetrahydrofolate deformylase [Salinisphaera sp. LB1]
MASIRPIDAAGSTRFILTATANSAQGQVAAISEFIDRYVGYIVEFDQFDDVNENRFFARVLFGVDPDVDSEALTASFAEVADRFDMRWSLKPVDARPRVLLMVSKTDHCLRDLLYRHERGELAMDITAIASNHRDLKPLADAYGFRFVHLPVTADTRAEQEAALWQLIEDTDTELVVLARYMQILSDDLSRKLRGWAINIHHSFLPGFKGAKPYRQAFVRGVKLIGATAHYVTTDLDEGPIIEQTVARVDHADSVSDLVAKGRDCECHTLARALALHLDGRVFLNGDRTVVLE